MKLFGRKESKPQEVRPAREFSVVVEEMAEAFRTGRVLRENLSRASYSQLCVEYLGKPLDISWHSPACGSKLMSFSYNGKSYTGYSDEADYILQAAKSRGQNRLEEIEREILARRALIAKKEMEGG